MSYWDQARTFAPQPPDEVPNKAWEPLLAAMRRMQVQAPTELPCVMPQYLTKRLPACGFAEGVGSKESFAGSDLALGLHQSPQRNPNTAPWIRLLEVNERLSAAIVYVQRACGE
jgi:hypothetical protein